uniref:Uncharacterized protein n=1 Tax=Pseudomonas phage HRDY3 TaxID=3236930 RepID=A0AB39CEE5_9VIRU
MNVQNYTGVLAAIIAAQQEAGDPSAIRRITVTEAEMDEIVKSGAFRKTTNTHYGGSDTPVFSNIESGSDGKVISLYFLGTLICLGPWEPTGALAGVTYGPLTVQQKGKTAFVRNVNGTDYMLVGKGNPADDFVLGKNANIELGIAVRKVNDSTYYGDGAGGFEIELDEALGESWNFAVTVGSLKAGVTDVTEMYDISLFLDVDGTGAENAIKWDLQYTPRLEGGGKNYAWFNQGIRVINDATTNPEGTVSQMIQRYEFPFISHALPASTERTKQGVPLGLYGIKLVATPRLTAGDAVEVEVLATVAKKS